MQTIGKSLAQHLFTARQQLNYKDFISLENVFKKSKRLKKMEYLQ